MEFHLAHVEVDGHSVYIVRRYDRPYRTENVRPRSSNSLHGVLHTPTTFKTSSYINPPDGKKRIRIHMSGDMRNRASFSYPPLSVLIKHPIPYPIVIDPTWFIGPNVFFNEALMHWDSSIEEFRKENQSQEDASSEQTSLQTPRSLPSIAPP